MADPASYRPAPGTIPTGPGVYRFSDRDGRVIYVGKAINLRQRLNSYFADPAALHFRTQTMVRTAAKVEWTLVRNELEALQLEYTWIKQFDPRFNVKYRDDKSYPWVAVTWSEEFPRVFVGRGSKRKGNRYFGPYAQAWAIRDTIDSLLRVFPMRSCTKGVFNSARASGRPCLMGYIGKCSAPCVGRIDAEAHRELVERRVRLPRRPHRRPDPASRDRDVQSRPRTSNSSGRPCCATSSSRCSRPPSATPSCSATAPTPTWWRWPRTRSRSPSRCSTCATAGSAASAAGWPSAATTAAPAELLELFLLQLYAEDE